MYYLDANTCIYFLNGKSLPIKEKLLTTPPNLISIPAIVKAELVLSAYKSKNKAATLEKVERFLKPYEIISFDDRMSYDYADIRSNLESKGRVIGPHDLLIAAMTRFNNAILVTHNIEEFGRVDHLKYEDWF